MSSDVCFLEEIAVSNLYGTDVEKKRVGDLISFLMTEPNNIEHIVELAVIIEEIKRREITRLDWNCCFCSECERFYNCRVKWYRGEHGMVQYCCSYCQRFDKCLARFQKQEKSRRLVEEIFTININGTEAEVKAAIPLIDDIGNINSMIKLSVLASDIKTREITDMYWQCCPKCNRYGSCKIKWQRGENGCQSYCCSYCQDFDKCLARFKRQISRDRRLVEAVFVTGVYGTDAEFGELLRAIIDIYRPQNVTKIAALSEAIKIREITGMDGSCCYHCDSFTRCKLVDENTAADEKRKCCSYCKKYKECLKKFKASKMKDKK